MFFLTIVARRVVYTLYANQGRVDYNPFAELGLFFRVNGCFGVYTLYANLGCGGCKPCINLSVYPAFITIFVVSAGLVADACLF